ncbi:MAG TPA: hypothetical protein VJ183_20450 [Chloroflexia bacterium]|nr:hypothetical protein [Chloroflexia bacterium]
MSDWKRALLKLAVGAAVAVGGQILKQAMAKNVARRAAQITETPQISEVKPDANSTKAAIKGLSDHLDAHMMAQAISRGNNALHAARMDALDWD